MPERGFGRGIVIAPARTVLILGVLPNRILFGYASGFFIVVAQEIGRSIKKSLARQDPVTKCE